MRHCTNETTRHKLYIARRREGGQRNVATLKKILRLRSELAHLLGYKDPAAYQLEIKMAKNADAVWAFYDKLIPLVREKAQLDFNELQAEKRRHTGDPSATLQSWDQSFYETRLLRDKYKVDTEQLRQYFPLRAVLDGVFMISEKLCGVKFSEVTDRVEKLGLKPRWHDSVLVFEARDVKDDTLRGHVYFDFFPREAKDSGAWQWGTEPYKVWNDGRVQRPVIVVNCNFTPPADDVPSLLDHTEVVTFFHEFGHVLHTLLSEVPYYRYSGASVARDFVEVPSLMLENWAWDRDVLKRFTKHYKTGEPLPDDLLDAALRAKHFVSGMKAQAQFWLGLTDMRYHTDPDGEVDTTGIGNETYDEVTMFTSPPNTFFEAGFGHLLGYQAGYYSYMWGLVYAQDVASKVREMGMLSPEAGERLRKTILSRGGSVEEDQMLRDFLGREPRMEPFLEHLGLEAQPLH
jgi:thimet oligopeptidase